MGRPPCLTLGDQKGLPGANMKSKSRATAPSTPRGRSGKYNPSATPPLPRGPSKSPSRPLRRGQSTPRGSRSRSQQPASAWAESPPTPKLLSGSSGGGGGGGGSMSSHMLRDRIKDAMRELQTIKINRQQQTSARGSGSVSRDSFSSLPPRAPSSSGLDSDRRPDSSTSAVFSFPSSPAASRPSSGRVGGGTAAAAQSPSQIKGMRKLIKRLYKRNTTLLSEVSDLKSRVSASSGERPDKDSGGDSLGAEGERKSKVDSTYAKDHLIYIIGQRDRVIAKLRAEIAEQEKEIAGLRHRLRTSAFVGGAPPGPGGTAAGTPRASATSTPRVGGSTQGTPRIGALGTPRIFTASTTSRPGSAAGGVPPGRGSEFRDSVLIEQFEKLRRDYEVRLSKKLKIVKAFKDLPKSILTIVEQMERQLIHETCHRQLERAMFDVRLFEMENAESCWFIDQKILNNQISDLRAELSSRDDVDARIEAQVYQILERSEKLERENKSLKARIRSSKERSAGSKDPESGKERPVSDAAGSTAPTSPVVVREGRTRGSRRKGAEGAARGEKMGSSSSSRRSRYGGASRKGSAPRIARDFVF